MNASESLGSRIAHLRLSQGLTQEKPCPRPRRERTGREQMGERPELP